MFHSYEWNITMDATTSATSNTIGTADRMAQLNPRSAKFTVVQPSSAWLSLVQFSSAASAPAFAPSSLGMAPLKLVMSPLDLRNFSVFTSRDFT